MLCLRLTALSRYQGTGILALDFSRIARYDAVVPVFGLASLHVYWTASQRQRLGWFALAGLVAALASLSHLYGAFWLVVLAVLVVWNRQGWRALLATGAGFALAWLPYLAYVGQDLPDWKGQVAGYRPRFDLLNWQWYLDNLRREPERYRLLAVDGPRALLRPGLWATLLLLPLSLAGLARNAFARKDRAARALLTPAILIPLLFALLIQLKLVNYAIVVMPLLALTLAWGLTALWGRARSRGRWLRAGLVILLAAVVFEGGAMIAQMQRRAATTTPYPQFIARVHQLIPPGSRVLGLHRYWFGLSDLDYRSWYVPIVQAGETGAQPALPIDQALDAIAPDVILVDPRMRSYFTGPSNPQARVQPSDILAWMDRRGYREAATVDDPTYGLMQIYRRSP